MEIFLMLCLQLELLPEMLDYPLLKPVLRPQGISSGDKANMTAAARQFECNCRAKIGILRQGRGRQEGVISCLDQQGRNLNRLQELLATGT